MGLFIYTPLFYFAKKIQSPSVYYFSLLLIGLRAITFPLIHHLQEDFTESGWTAIKSFDFSLFAYFRLIIADGITFLVILIAFIFLRKLLPKFTKNIPKAINIRKRGHSILKGVSKNNAPPMVLLFILVNYFIFAFANENKIGITGIEPDALPLKLSGIIYYYEKFLGPFILFLLIKNSKSIFLVSTITPLLIFIGISTLSRSTIAAWAIPIFYVAFQNCKSTILSSFIIFVLLFSAMMAGIGRNLMFIADGSAIGLDTSIGMLDIFLAAYSSVDASDLILTGASLVSRLGGGQEMVLGFQTAFPDYLYALRLLFQLFTGTYFGIDYQSLVILTHDFVPLEGTVAGIAYSGYALAFLNSSPFIYLLFAIFSAAILNLNDQISSMIYKISRNEKLSNISCFALNFIFFAMFMVSWYWFTIFLICAYIFSFKRFFVQ